MRKKYNQCQRSRVRIRIGSGSKFSKWSDTDPLSCREAPPYKLLIWHPNESYNIHCYIVIYLYCIVYNLLYYIYYINSQRFIYWTEYTLYIRDGYQIGRILGRRISGLSQKPDILQHGIYRRIWAIYQARPDIRSIIHIVYSYYYIT